VYELRHEPCLLLLWNTNTFTNVRNESNFGQFYTRVRQTYYRREDNFLFTTILKQPLSPQTSMQISGLKVSPGSVGGIL